MKKAEKLAIIKQMIADKKTDAEIISYSEQEKWKGNIVNYIQEVKDDISKEEIPQPTTPPETPPVAPIVKDKKEKVVDNGKPRDIKKKTLIITKIVRNMKGGATLSFKGKNDDVVISSNTYEVGDEYEVSVVPKKNK